MNHALVIVESPAKAKTLERYLGAGFKVYACYGHVRDLLSKSGAVDPENGFEMKWVPVDRNRRHIDQIAKALKKADHLYLATDPDREGEAISWHLCELLRQRNCLQNKHVSRVVFHEVTKNAVNAAMEKPRELSHNLVDAQQTRRALDYLVGFNLSPLLGRKICQGLSAGRVQSPALRLIAEREQEVREFQPREYWTVEAALEHSNKALRAKLIVWQGEKLQQFSITDAARASAIKEHLSQQAADGLLVRELQRKQRKRYPAPPFITSTLQQEAVRKLGFTTQRTMRVAQQLYEGISMDSEIAGLITYMRTDSVNLANEGIEDIRNFIDSNYGKDSLPSAPRHYKTKSRNAQEAHEAIRPTLVGRTPSMMKSYLDREQLLLYELIWKRTIACQMTHAVIDTVAVDMECGKDNLFRATGSTISVPGFMEVYLEGRDDERDETHAMLPEMRQGDRITAHEIEAIQHFTEPPPRYGEASLVKTLEEYGIGRPSTYASIVQTLLQRGYVELEGKRFVPTDLGCTVNRFLTEHFTVWVDYEFTAKMEESLDAISRGEKERLPILTEFWQELSEQIAEKEANVSRSDVLQRRVLGNDPASGKEVSVRIGRYGPFAQIGTREDDEKPRFAGLLAGQRMDSISLEEAMKLFELPRTLGAMEDGTEIVANIGRYGPYVRYGSKFASLGKQDDPYDISLERARILIAEKEKRDREREIRVFPEQRIKVMKVRFGAMIEGENKKVRVPKDRDPASLSLEECVQLLEQGAPVSSRRGGSKAVQKKTAKKKTAKKKTAKKKTAKKKTRVG